MNRTSWQWLKVGTRFIGVGDLAAAEAAFRQALACDAVFVEAVYNLGWVLDEQGRHVEAVAEFERAVRLDAVWEDARISTRHAMRMAVTPKAIRTAMPRGAWRFVEKPRLAASP